MITERIGLGLFVASPNFRHPVPFAKEVATLDDISGGRVLLGIGSGGTGFDAFVLGQAELTPGERHRRYLEFVEGLDVLLRFEQADAGGISFAGEWFTAHEARMVGAPRRDPRMPLLLAGNGPRAIRYAAQRGDGWVTTGGNENDDVEAWWAGVAELVRRFDDALDAAGRTDIPRFLSLDDEGRYSLASAAAYEDAVGRAEALGFTDVVAHWPRAGRHLRRARVRARGDRGSALTASAVQVRRPGQVMMAGRIRVLTRSDAWRRRIVRPSAPPC